jgi:hypothetical protein
MRRAQAASGASAPTRGSRRGKSAFGPSHKATSRRQRPLEERRDALSRLVAGVDNILFSEALPAEGAIVFAKACELGLEGIVSKRAGQPVLSGGLAA